MREYSSKISLTKNARGVYSLDTSIGCKSGMENEIGGCYNDCYAAKSAKLYGYDFSKTVFRHFENETHRRKILAKINKVKLDFIRIGTSGDPSEDWEHTVEILKKIDTCNKEIVIITKHWTNLTKKQLEYFGTINVCVNTSISALDKPKLMKNSLRQYNRLMPFCKSILRVISCDFNLENKTGRRLAKIQDSLLLNDPIIDTVLRLNKRNPLFKSGIINAKAAIFLGKNAFISKLNRKTYFGKCDTCREMCGIRLESKNNLYPKKRGISKQLTIF